MYVQPDPTYCKKCKHNMIYANYRVQSLIFPVRVPGTHVWYDLVRTPCPVASLVQHGIYIYILQYHLGAQSTHIIILNVPHVCLAASEARNQHSKHFAFFHLFVQARRKWHVPRHARHISSFCFPFRAHPQQHQTTAQKATS